MNFQGHTLWVLAIVLFFGLILPQFFKRIQIPFTTSMILLGSLFGPFGLDYISPDDTMKTIGFLGGTFHMLLTGFDAEALHINRAGKRIWYLAALNIVIPFLVGLAIVRLFGYPWDAAAFMGITFMSSSIMLVFSNVSYLQMGETNLGFTLKSLVVIVDLASLAFAFVLLQYVSPHTRYPLLILLGLLASSVIILRMFMPELVTYFFHLISQTRDEFEGKLRLIITLLFSLVLLYAALDVHPFIAAFIVGFTLSEVSEVKPVKEKLQTIGYALFVPVFLFVVGMEIDLKIITRLNLENYLLLTLVFGAFLSKFFSGWVAARLVKIPAKESILIGISSTTKLTIAISMAFAALQVRLIDNQLFTAIVIVSAISTIINPSLLAYLVKKWMPSA